MEQPINESTRTLLVVFSASASVGVPYLAFGLWFAPGWANGWPLLSPYFVWSAGLGLLAGVWLFAIATGNGLLFAWAFGPSQDEESHDADRWLVRWLVAAGLAAAAVGVWVGVSLHAGIRAARIWG